VSFDELKQQYDAVMQDLDALGTEWLEAHAAGRNTQTIADRITQTDKLSRKLERKLRKAGSGRRGT